MVVTERLRCAGGYRGEPVPATLFRHEEGSAQLAIVLPGIGYHGDLPLLYYPTRYFLQQGIDVFRVEYAYAQQPEYNAASPEVRRAWLRADVLAAYQALAGQRDQHDERVILLGKSLGTLAMADLLTAVALAAPVTSIWLTPLLWDAGIRDQITRAGKNALTVIGTADPIYDAGSVDALRRSGAGEVLVINGADHSLEEPGDVLGSIDALRSTMREIQRLLTA